MRLVQAVVILTALAAAGCSGRKKDQRTQKAPSTAQEGKKSVKGTAAEKKPNLILVVMDTVRADSVSAGGYSRATTPFLDTLVSEGVFFTNARSTSSWTHPAHASMFTGLVPSVHSARYAGKDLLKERQGTAAVIPMRKDIITLQELLKQAGYTTVGSVGAVLLNPGLGVTRGFESFAPAVVGKDPDAHTVNTRLLELLDEKPDDGLPVFVFVNYFDAHGPYAAHVEHAPWLEEFENLDAADLLERENGIPLFARLCAGTQKLTDSEWNRIRALYDSEIAFVDHHMKKLFAELDSRGILDNALVIITSDHGEYMGEHGGMADHGRTLYEELVHVPLLLWGKKHVPAGIKIDRPVSLRDVFFTFTELAGIEFRFRNPGCSLMAVAKGASCPGRPLVSEAFADPAVAPAAPRIFGQDYASVVQWPFKLIMKSSGETELYDLQKDPHELNKLTGPFRKKQNELVNIYKSWRLNNPAHKPDLTAIESQGPGPLTRERLKALGYIE